MRIFMLPLVAMLVINFLIDWWLFRKFSRSHGWVKRLKWPHVALSVILLGIIAAVVLQPVSNVTESNDAMSCTMWFIYTYVAFYVPRYIALLFYPISLLPWLSKRSRKVVQMSCVAIGAIVFFEMLWGSFVVPKNPKVNEVTIESSKLPAEFDGYRLVHISDMHLGTYGNDTSTPKKVVDMINSLKPDLVCFTGDIVSRLSSEADPHTTVLSQIKAPQGVVSVLGNHDYDDYVNWPTLNDKLADRERLKRLEREMGWLLLCDSTILVERGDKHIAIIGTENYGEEPFPKYGNLSNAYTDLNDSTFKVLLQHNPYDWRAEVLPKSNIDLMLAGHTHAMQMMFTLFGKNYSPAVLRYKEWGGLYTEGEQNLYVNIGIGMVGMPARLGSAYPEITVITLKHKP